MGEKRQGNTSATRPERLGRLLAFVILTAAICLLLFGSSPWAAPLLSPHEQTLTQQDTTVRTGPVQSTVTVDESFTVSVMIDDVSDLGAFQFNLLYIATIVRVDSVTLGNFLGSTGRSVATVGPIIDNGAGKVTFGAFSFWGGAGPDGSGELAIISLIAQGGGESPLALQSVLVLDTDSHSQPITVEDGSVVASGLPKFTPTPTATPVPAPVGGIIVPVNKLELLAPWICLTLLGLATAILLVRRHTPEQG